MERDAAAEERNQEAKLYISQACLEQQRPSPTIAAAAPALKDSSGDDEKKKKKEKRSASACSWKSRQIEAGRVSARSSGGRHNARPRMNEERPPQHRVEEHYQVAIQILRAWLGAWRQAWPSRGWNEEAGASRWSPLLKTPVVRGTSRGAEVRRQRGKTQPRTSSASSRWGSEAGGQGRGALGWENTPLC